MVQWLILICIAFCAGVFLGVKWANRAAIRLVRKTFPSVKFPEND